MEREELLKEIIELIITSTDDEIQEAFERLKIQRDLTSLVSMVGGDIKGRTSPDDARVNHQHT